MPQTKEKETEILQLRIDLDHETKEMFQAFQEKYNIHRLTDTFRLIVKKAYDLDIAIHEKQQP